MSAVESDGIAAKWRGELARPSFVDADKARSMADGALMLQAAMEGGFTDFVIIGLAADPGLPEHEYRLRVFSRPRTRSVLMHIVQTADHYVAECLAPERAS